MQMSLKAAYRRLLSETGYSFVVAPTGDIVDWEDYPGLVGVGQAQAEVCLHVVPGSFNPLHVAHKEIRDHISWPSVMTFYEISIVRVDKEMVSFDELQERLGQFKNYAPVVVTRAARFVEKIGTLLQHAKLLVFHVGIDTVTRMRDDYGTIGIQGLAATFVVHDRVVNGTLRSLSTSFVGDTPFNCVPSPAVRSAETLAMSSSKIRKEGIGHV